MNLARCGEGSVKRGSKMEFTETQSTEKNRVKISRKPNYWTLSHCAYETFAGAIAERLMELL